MGEIAEMTLDGTLCSVCGVYLGLDTGYPVQCHDCKEELRKKYTTRVPKNKKKKTYATNR